MTSNKTWILAFIVMALFLLVVGSLPASHEEGNRDKTGTPSGQERSRDLQVSNLSALATPGFRSGEGGIRTPERLASLPVFETGPIGRSGTSPNYIIH